VIGMRAGRKRRMTMRHRRSSQRGFTYLGLMVLIVIMGIVLASAGQVWHVALKREKEQELLFVGNQFRHALSQFSEYTPGQARRQPSRLEELLQDPRYPGTKRYLRKIYADPITGRAEWGLIKGPGGEIYGVHSLSDDEPVKKGNFSLADAMFENRQRYSDWVFMPQPGQTKARAVKRP
jgi:type II secretory pathway pseudopilin PulG